MMSTQRFARISAALLAVPLSACISFSSVDKATPFSSASDKAMVVIGVKPDYRVAAMRGKLDATGSFSHTGSGVAVFNIIPEQGYIVSLLSPTAEGERYAITQVLPDGVGGPVFKPCDGLETATFSAKAGQLLYLGDFKYGFQGDSLSIDYRVEPVKASDYLKSAYPRVQADLVYMQPEMRAVSGSPCKSTRYIIIPVVVPR